MLASPPDLLSRYDESLAQIAIPEHRRPHYCRWLRLYVDFCAKYERPARERESVRACRRKLEEKGQPSGCERRRPTRFGSTLFLGDSEDRHRPETRNDPRAPDATLAPQRDPVPQALMRQGLRLRRLPATPARSGRRCTVASDWPGSGTPSRARRSPPHNGAPRLAERGSTRRSPAGEYSPGLVGVPHHRPRRVRQARRRGPWVAPPTRCGPPPRASGPTGRRARCATRQPPWLTSGGGLHRRPRTGARLSRRLHPRRLLRRFQGALRQ